MEPKKRAPRAAMPPQSAPKPAPFPETTEADRQRFRNSPEYQEMQDQRLREKEDKAPTTRSTMGEGKLRLFRAGGAVKQKYAAGGGVEERISYRNRPDYFGYEDYTPSGRAALQAYNKAEEGATDMQKRRYSPPFSPSAARKAQSAQRESAAQIKRETRGKVPEGMYAKGGTVSASRRADGCAQRGKTRGKMI